jgi:Uma2 family endonuclease
VLSPSSRRADRFTKRLEYQRQRVPRYWIVDPDGRSVEVWTPDDSMPRFERERLVWRPAGASTAFRLELLQLFKPI